MISKKRQMKEFYWQKKAKNVKLEIEKLKRWRFFTIITQLEMNLCFDIMFVLIYFKILNKIKKYYKMECYMRN